MRSWSGVQSLTRAIPAALVGGPWVDTFYRKRLNVWVVWSLLPPEDDQQHRSVILLGAFKDRAMARFAADTAFVACRKDSNFMPMMLDLLAEGQGGDFLDVLHGVSHYADSAPWTCQHRQRTTILSPLVTTDLELLTKQIERCHDDVQDWRFMWLGFPGLPASPTLIRIRNKRPAAAFVLSPDTFDSGTVSVWIEDKSHDLPCKPASITENVLSAPVLDNLVSIMRYCDAELRKRYGADTNADEFIALLREENYRESSRQMAVAFGTAHHVGEA